MAAAPGRLAPRPPSAGSARRPHSRPSARASTETFLETQRALSISKERTRTTEEHITTAVVTVAADGHRGRGRHKEEEPSSSAASPPLRLSSSSALSPLASPLSGSPVVGRAQQSSSPRSSAPASAQAPARPRPPSASASSSAASASVARPSTASRHASSPQRASASPSLHHAHSQRHSARADAQTQAASSGKGGVVTRERPSSARVVASAVRSSQRPRSARAASGRPVSGGGGDGGLGPGIPHVPGLLSGAGSPRSGERVHRPGRPQSGRPSYSPRPSSGAPTASHRSDAWAWSGDTTDGVSGQVLGGTSSVASSPLSSRRSSISACSAPFVQPSLGGSPLSPSSRPGSGRPGSGRPGSGRPGSGRPGSERLGSSRPGSSKVASGRNSNSSWGQVTPSGAGEPRAHRRHHRNSSAGDRESSPFDDENIVSPVVKPIRLSRRSVDANAPATNTPYQLTLLQAYQLYGASGNSEGGLRSQSVSIAYLIAGQLDAGRLRRALSCVDAHFGLTRQLVLPGLPISFAFDETAPAAAFEEQASEAASIEMDVQLLQSQPFDLSSSQPQPLLRLVLLRYADEKAIVLLSAARVSLDTFSLAVYGRALWDAYALPAKAPHAAWPNIASGARVDNIARAEAQGLRADIRGLQAVADFWQARECEGHGERRRLPRPRFFLNARSSSTTVSRRFRLSRSNLSMFQALLVLPPHCPIGEADVCFVTAYSVLAVLTAYLTQQDNFVMGHTLSSSPQELGRTTLGPFQQTVPLAVETRFASTFMDVFASIAQQVTAARMQAAVPCEPEIGRSRADGRHYTLEVLYLSQEEVAMLSSSEIGASPTLAYGGPVEGEARAADVLVSPFIPAMQHSSGSNLQVAFWEQLDRDGTDRIMCDLVCRGPALEECERVCQQLELLSRVVMREIACEAHVLLSKLYGRIRRVQQKSAAR